MQNIAAPSSIITWCFRSRIILQKWNKTCRHLSLSFTLDTCTRTMWIEICDYLCDSMKLKSWYKSPHSKAWSSSQPGPKHLDETSRTKRWIFVDRRSFGDVGTLAIYSLKIFYLVWCGKQMWINLSIVIRIRTIAAKKKESKSLLASRLNSLFPLRTGSDGLLDKFAVESQKAVGFHPAHSKKTFTGSKERSSFG